ncbi:MAG: hypothetical protein KF724_12135 [Phycisphaeraceae bacterium]|nr:hypothetical protein [Phycisphaeraceae bacterium]
MTSVTSANGVVPVKPNGNGTHRWAAVLLTAALAVLAMTVQWGVVTTKLDHVEKRLDELIVEARSLRAEYQSIERRISWLEGRSLGGVPQRAKP